jgi:hypothetical protein
MPYYSKCDFSKALIYKIICKNPEIKDVYIGSTCNFKKRINNHKKDSKNKNLKVYNCINENGGWDNWAVEIIQKYPCTGFEELKILEDHYIKEMGTLNGKNAVHDKKEYRQLNIDKISERERQYYQLNKDKISERDRQYRQLNIDKIRERERRSYQLNKDKKNESKKRYYELNKDKISEYGKKYYQLNKDKIKQYFESIKDKKNEYDKKYRELNKDKMREKDKKYREKKKAEAVNFYDNMRLILNNKNLSEKYKMDHISDVQTLKVPELKELVRRYGLKKTSKLSKAQLVNVLMEHLESIVADPEPVKAEDVLQLPTQDLEDAVAELSVESDETPPESPPRKIRKPRKRKTISDSD